MGTRYIVGDLKTGRRIVNLPVVSGTWEDDLDSAETCQATVKLNDPVVRMLDLRNAATVAKTFLAAIDVDPFGQDVKVNAAGPIWATTYDRAASTLQLTAKGIASLLDHRIVLPPSALTAGVATWTIPDPADAQGVGTIPNPALATTYSNMSLAGIGVSLVAQALSWSGGALPIVLPSVTTGTSTRTYQGADFKTVGSALQDLSGVIGGPEFNFMPRFTADRLGIEWVMQTGTDAQPLIYAGAPNAPIITNWNVTAAQSPVKALTIDLDGSGVASLAWATGGRDADKALVSRSYSSSLTDRGYPLLEVVDSTHTDVVLQATLDGYAAAGLVYSSGPSETWTFSVKAHPLDENDRAAGPQLGDYSTGDFIHLHIDKHVSRTGRGDLYVPSGGDPVLRIVGLSGDVEGEDILIKCSPVIGG